MRPWIRPAVYAAPQVAAFGLVLLLAFGAGCGTEKDRFGEHLGRGEAHAAAGRVDEALIEMKNALQIQPTDAGVNLRIAELLAGRGDYANSIFYYKEAQRLDPASSKALLGEALIVMFEDPDRGEALVEKALGRNPDDARAQAVRADLALVRGDTETALEAAHTAVELEPQNPDWHMQLGIVEQARIREQQALGNPISDRQFQRAIRSFNQASEYYQGKGHWRPAFQRAKVLAAWPGQTAEAPAAFRRAAEQAAEAEDPRVEIQALRAILDQARAMGDRELRGWALERLSEVDPGSMGHWRELAVLARASGEPAEPVYERMLERLPDQVNAHLLFANAKASAGEVEEALAHLEKVEAQVSDPALLRAGRLDLLRSVGRKKEAEAALASLAVDFPGHPHTRLAQGQRALSEMRFEEGVEILRGVANETEGSDALRLLAQGELARGNATAAVQAADRYLAQKPSDPAEIFSLKARAQVRAGDASGAIATLTRLAEDERPLEPDERLLAARAHYLVGQDSRARRILNVLLQREDAPAGAALLFARRESSSQPDHVRAALERMATRMPTHDGVQYELVRIDLATGRIEEAKSRLEGLETAGRLTPPLQLARAQVRAAEGDAEGARADALGALRKQPSLPGALPLLVSLYGEGDDIGPAIEAVEEGGRERLDAEGLAVLARLHLKNGADAEARKLFEASLAKKPLPGTQNDIAYLMARDGENLDRALALAKQAQSALPEDPFISDTLGFVYLKKGLHQPAVEQFRYAVELAQTRNAPRPEFHHHLGLALRALDRQALAVESLEAALATDPDFAGADDARRQLEAARIAVAEAAAAAAAAEAETEAAADSFDDLGPDS